ncbi:hypothetical protein ABN028_19610 [Actinopolymorpha sp. B17G11]|uniref:hypothetical protein n=1 Tax=Actinopolymorpha sp. B17G11 TaxID=3160861 RepID=UPI0032E4D9C2
MHTITLVPDRYNKVGRWDSPNVIRTYSAYQGHTVRLAIGYVDANGTCRRKAGRPMEPGPYVYTFPMASVIDNHGGTGAESARNKAAGLEWDAEPGDEFLIDGVVYRLTAGDRWSDPDLIPVEGPIPAPEWPEGDSAHAMLTQLVADLRAEAKAAYDRQEYDPDHECERVCRRYGCNNTPDSYEGFEDIGYGDAFYEAADRLEKRVEAITAK